MVDSNGLTLLHRVPVTYPQEALNKRIEGDVIVDLTLSATGAVSDAHVLSGPDELRKATLESVLQWHYANEAQLPTKTEATIKFRLPQTPAASASPMPALDGTTTVKDIALRAPKALREKLEGRIPLHEGDQITQTSLNDLIAAVREVDEHLSVAVQPTADKSLANIIISLDAEPPENPCRRQCPAGQSDPKGPAGLPGPSQTGSRAGQSSIHGPDRQRWPRPECGSDQRGAGAG